MYVQNLDNARDKDKIVGTILGNPSQPKDSMFLCDQLVLEIYMLLILQDGQQSQELVYPWNSN